MRINIAKVTEKKTSEGKSMLSITDVDGRRFGCFEAALFKVLHGMGTVDVEIEKSGPDGKYTNIVQATKIGQAHPVNQPDEQWVSGAASAIPPVAFAELPDKVTALGARLDEVAKALTGINEELVNLRKAVFARSQADPEKDKRITRLSCMSTAANLFQGVVKPGDPPDVLALHVTQLLIAAKRLENWTYRNGGDGEDPGETPAVQVVAPGQGKVHPLMASEAQHRAMHARCEFLSMTEDDLKKLVEKLTQVEVDALSVDQAAQVIANLDNQVKEKRVKLIPR